MPDKDQIIATLQHMLAHELDLRFDEREITATVPLLEGGLMLDSMVLFELITLIETRYGVCFPEEALSTSNFSNLTVLADRVTSLLGESSVEEAGQ